MKAHGNPHPRDPGPRSRPPTMSTVGGGGSKLAEGGRQICQGALLATGNRANKTPRDGRDRCGSTRSQHALACPAFAIRPTAYRQAPNLSVGDARRLQPETGWGFRSIFFCWPNEFLAVRIGSSDHRMARLVGHSSGSEWPETEREKRNVISRFQSGQQRQTAR